MLILICVEFTAIMYMYSINIFIHFKWSLRDCNIISGVFNDIDIYINNEYVYGQKDKSYTKRGNYFFKNYWRICQSKINGMYGKKKSNYSINSDVDRIEEYDMEIAQPMKINDGLSMKIYLYANDENLISKRL